MKRLISILAIFLMSAGMAQAQNTRGTHSPVVKPDDKSAQYRIAIDTDNDTFAQRLHFQQSINDQLRWRAILQTRETSNSDVDIDYLRAELLWQLTQDDSQDYQTGLRFDFRVRQGEDRPALFAVNWTNSWKIGNGWDIRAIAIGGLEIGDGRDDGILLETRARLNKKLSGKTSIGLEMFNDIGTTSDIPDFDDQEHQIGPYISQKVTPSTTLRLGTLFGVTENSSDMDLRIFVNQGF